MHSDVHTIELHEKILMWNSLSYHQVDILSSLFVFQFHLTSQELEEIQKNKAAFKEILDQKGNKLLVQSRTNRGGKGVHISKMFYNLLVV